MTYHPRPETRAATERLYARVLELWAMGYSAREIGRRVDRSSGRVTQIVAQFGTGADYRAREEAITNRD